MSGDGLLARLVQEAAVATDERRQAALAALRGETPAAAAAPMSDWVNTDMLRKKFARPDGSPMPRLALYRLKLPVAAKLGGANWYSLAEVEAVLRKRHRKDERAA